MLRSTADELDQLRPHLARAALLSARLGLDRAKTNLATLEMIGLSAGTSTNTGRANDALKFESESRAAATGRRDLKYF